MLVDFVIDKFFMKLFKTISLEVIQSGLCRSYFCFELLSILLKKERKNLDTSTGTMNIITLSKS